MLGVDKGSNLFLFIARGTLAWLVIAVILLIYVSI